MVDSKRYNKKGYFIGEIDGTRCRDIKSFLFEIGKAFHFPDYYGQNMNALNDCISDLDWIQEKHYLLIVRNFKDFLIDETFDKRMSILDFLDRIAYEWQNVPNYEGEDQFRHKADFKIIKEYSDCIET